MDISYFFNKPIDISKEVFISNRFKDKQGVAMPFIIKPITEAENEMLRISSRDLEGRLDYDKYLLKLVASCIASPNLQDSNLQKSYGVLGEEKVLSAMLLAGEYALLLENVQNICGFDTPSKVEEIKNV